MCLQDKFSSNDFNTIIKISGPSVYSEQFWQSLWIAMTKDHSFLQEKSDHPDRIGRMPRLFRVIDMRIFIYTNSTVPNQMTKNTASHQDLHLIKIICISRLTSDANSSNPDKTEQKAVLDLGLHCLRIYTVKQFLVISPHKN